MLNQSTLDKLYALRLTGMAEAYQQQLNGVETRGLSFEERFGMLVDNHWTWRENQSLLRRLKFWPDGARRCHEATDLLLAPQVRRRALLTGREQVAGRDLGSGVDGVEVRGEAAHGRA